MSNEVTPDGLIVGPLVVLTHEHDEAAGLYRIVIGREIRTPSFMHEVHVLDDGGNPTYDSVVQRNADGDIIMTAKAVLDANNEPQFADEDDPSTLITELVPVVELMPVTAPETVPEQVVGHADVQDSVFADDDSRWFTSDGERRSNEDIAADQRQDLKDALDRAAEEAAISSPPAQELPGVGEEL